LLLRASRNHTLRQRSYSRNVLKREFRACEKILHGDARPRSCETFCYLFAGTDSTAPASNIMTGCDSLKEKFYDPRRYSNDTVFLEMIENHVGSGSVVLDLGAGAGQKFPYGLKYRVGPTGQIVGADFDSRVCDNPLVHRGVVLNGPILPFDDGTFDVVFTRYVLEHVAEPQGFLTEVHRVLKSGGSFLFLTPNKWHYVCIAARCTPECFHKFYNRQRGQQETDTFPTAYRLNTRSALRRRLVKVGFVERELRMRECCPNYLTLAKPLFLIGVAYERLVNATELLSGFRVNILGYFMKPDNAEH
jgi:SAM-dependent methyltransferase